MGPHFWQSKNEGCLNSDVVYRPLETNFLKYFDNPKNKTYGISMLVYQAAPCFNKWFGVSPAVDARLLDVLKKEADLWRYLGYPETLLVEKQAY